jgi:hypothetical protein
MNEIRLCGNNDAVSICIPDPLLDKWIIAHLELVNEQCSPYRTRWTLKPWRWRMRVRARTLQKRRIHGWVGVGVGVDVLFECCRQ